MATGPGVLFLSLLFSVLTLTVAQTIDSSTLDAAVNRLSIRFEWLRQYGLGVGSMEETYRSTPIAYETIDDDGMAMLDSVFSMSSPQSIIDGVLHTLNQAIGASNNNNEEPPDCEMYNETQSDLRGCCFNCNDSDADFILYNDFAPRVPASYPVGTEFFVGLLGGELFQFPHVSVNYFDPRLTKWYSRAFANSSREIVIFLDLNTPTMDTTELTDAALNVIESLTPHDRVALVIVGTDRQRICPSSLSYANDTQKSTISRIIRENLLESSAVINYAQAINSANSFFTNSPDSQKLLLLLVDSETNGDFTTLQSTGGGPGGFRLRVYGQGDFTNISLAGEVVMPLSDIGSYWTGYANDSSLPLLLQTKIISTDFNQRGEQCISISRIWNRSPDSRFAGVMITLVPWKWILAGLEAATNLRPSSYFFTGNRRGEFLYYSRYPMTDVVGVDPRTLERSMEFIAVQSFLINGQNDSMPFNNTFLYLQPSFNQSYFRRNVPSVYHCQLILDGIVYDRHEVPGDEIFACLVLADEDQSVVDLYNITSFPSQQSPLYQTALSDTSLGRCTDICQISNEERLVLQLTGSSTPPATVNINTLNSYLTGGMSRPSGVPEGTAEEVAVQSDVGGVWLNTNYRNPAIIRRYLTTPTGIFLSYPGINLNSQFTPQSLPSYIPAVTHTTLTLTPAQTDLLNPETNVTTFSISQALRMGPMDSSGSTVLSVLAADLTMTSLRVDVNSLLDGSCSTDRYECTVLTDDGYFVLLPPNPPTSPLHMTEYSNYNGITLSLLESGILMKEGCSVMDNYTVSHDRFYSFNSTAIGDMSCYTTTFGCKDFCIRSITNTSAFLLIAYDKQQCLTDPLTSCQVGKQVCTFCDTFTNNIQCPCSCSPPICAIPSFNLPICPSKRYVPINYSPAARDVTLSNGLCTATCTNRTRDSCNPYYCTWCTANSICVTKGSCCVSEPNCCDDPSVTSLPPCLANICVAPSATPPVSPTPVSPNVLAIVIGATLGGVAGIVLLAAFICCCVWYQVCRIPDAKEEKDGNEFTKAVNATNPTHMEMGEKNGGKTDGEKTDGGKTGGEKTNGEKTDGESTPL